MSALLIRSRFWRALAVRFVAVLALAVLALVFGCATPAGERPEPPPAPPSTP